MIGLGASPEQLQLPALREDIRLLPARAAANGAPQWVIFDPLAHAYFQLDGESFQLLNCWFAAKTAGELSAEVASRHGRKPEHSEIEAMIRFIGTNRLTAEPAGGWRTLADASRKQQESLFKTLLHNYLFFKLPLIRPDRLLTATMPVARLLASPWLLGFVAIIGALGLFLVSRRWEQFIGTFSDFWSPAGALFLAGALLALKLCHELGHAYAAKARGCAVPSMGVAVMLGAPMPYTDVTDAWKLRLRRDRMAIDLAGVKVEMAIAAIATFLWVFLPDGPMRSAAFLFATTGWVMSLAVNLNPFMRFDGYFVLADLLNVPNLQPRSFALARWQLRRSLFGADEPSPDHLEGGLRRLVILYGFGVWLYRLVLFTGIALVVYHMFFKLLGLLLFLIEIVVFIVAPVWRELRHWWSERKRYISHGRTALTASVLTALLAVFFVPWSSTVHVPAMLEPRGFARVFPKTSGEVVAVNLRPGQVVQAGDVLIELDQPKLRKELAVTSSRIAVLNERLDRRVADRKDLTASLQLDQEKAALEEKRAALQRELAELEIRAPFKGVILETNPALHKGRSIARDEEIAVLADGPSLVTRGYVRQEDLWRLKSGNAGLFVPEDLGSGPLSVVLQSVAPAGARSVEVPGLASIHGGKVETWPQSKSGEIAPVHASHLATFDVTGSISRKPEQVRRGTVRLNATPESIAARAWRHVLRVLVQESGA